MVYKILASSRRVSISAIGWLLVFPPPIAKMTLSAVISKKRSAYFCADVFQTPTRAFGTALSFADWQPRVVARRANARRIAAGFIGRDPPVGRDSALDRAEATRPWS